MAITLEELRKQVREQAPQTSDSQGKMTLAQLRQQAGTTAPQTETAGVTTSASFENKGVVLPVENDEKQENKGFLGNLKDVGGAFVESGKQGVGNALSNLQNTYDIARAYAAAPGSIYDEIQETFYDVNKAGQVAEIVQRNQEQYGMDSEYVQDIQQGIVDRNAQQAQKLADIQEKYKDNKYADIAITAGQGIGNLLPSMAVGAVTGIAGAGTAAFGANVFGGAMSEALSSGATLEQATGYAAADAAMETGIEMLFGGIPFLNKGVAKVEELSAKYLKTAAGQLLANRLMDITGEGFEEVASSIIEPFLKRAFYDKNAENATLSDMATAFGGGALVSAILGVADFGGNVQEYRKIKKNIAEKKAQRADAAPQTTENAENAAEMMPTQENVLYGMSVEDENRYINTGKKASTRHKKEKMIAAGKSPIIKTVQEFKNFVKGAIDGEVKDEIKAYAKSSERLANAVYEKSGGKIDISDMFMELDSNDIRHSYVEHLKGKQSGDINLSITDYENIAEYIENFDDIIYAEKTGQGTRIQLGKKINGYSVITEIVSNERNAVKFRNMWGVSTEKYEQKYKNRGRANRPDTQKVSSVPSGTNSYSDDIVTQNDTKMQQRAADNLQTVHQLQAQGIDTGDAVQKLTEVITGESIPQAAPAVVERENARVAAIEETARQGIATAEQVQLVKDIAAENIRQSENKAVVAQKFGDEEINRIEELAKLKGYKVVYESDDSEDAPNGYIQGNTIYINSAGNSPYFNVAVHEVLHGVRGNTAKWDKLRKSVYQMIGSDSDMTKFADNVVATYTEDQNSAAYKSLLTDGKLDQTKLDEEIVANFVEEYLPKIAQNEEHLMEAIKKDRTLIDGLLDIIRGIKNNLAIKFTKSEKAMLDEAERNLVNLLRTNSSTVEKKKYSLKTYTIKQKENWRNSKSIIIYENNSQLERFIDDALSNKNLDKKLYFGIVPESLSKAVKKETGINIENFNCTLRADNIKKILRDHGREITESPRGQRVIVKQDFLDIPDVIENATHIELSDKLYEGKPVLLFHKDGKTIVAYVSNKHLDLTTQTMYAKKNKGLATAVDANAPTITPKAHIGTTFTNNSISNSRDNINGKNVSGNNSQKQQRNSSSAGISQGKYSLKIGDKDSQRNRLYEEQKKYFNDRKVIDNTGALMTESREQPNKKFSLISGRRRIEIERVDNNLVIDNNQQLENEINKIYSGESEKTLYVGLAKTDVIKNIKSKVTDIADDKIDQFLRDNVEYAIRIVPSDLIHFKKDGMKLDEVIQYVKRIPEIITEFDNVRYTVYRTGNALRFDKTFSDGKYYSMAVVSNKKSTLTVHNVFMDKADYINKKRLATPRLAETNAANNTPEANGGLSSSIDNIPQTINNGNGKNVSGNNSQKQQRNSSSAGISQGKYSRQLNSFEYDGESAKSRGIRKKAVDELADNLGRRFGITGKIGKEGLRNEAYRIADKVEKFGFITKADMDNFFDAAAQAARFTDEKADYAPLKKLIRETGIEPVGGREYLDFLQKYKGKVKFKRGGMPIDVFYQQLAGEYPEYINGDITNPADQMWRLGRVYDSLRSKEMTVSEYYGDRAQDYINESYAEYAREVDLFVDKINSVSRYKKANVEGKATKDRAQPARTYTLQDVQNAYKNSSRIEKEITKLMADTALTDGDKSLLDDLQKIKNPRVLAATLKDMQENNPNAKAIYKLYNLKQELAQVKEPIREYRKANKDRNRQEFMDLLTTSKSWQEKHKFGGLRYKAETFERIIDDVVTDKKAAERLKDMLPRSIHKHVAEGNRYKNELRDRVRRLNLDRKKLYDVEFENKNNQLIQAELTESGLVQIYGEGLVTKEYLDKIGADVQKIAEAAEEFRKIYNEMIEKINEAYVRNGYKPIEYRKDYFPHFMEDGTDVLLNKMTSWFGIDAMSNIPANWQRALAKVTVKNYTNDGMLPTEIAGTTYKRSPGRKYNAHALQRMGENTVYDALKGFDNYLETAADVIFLTDDIQNLRSFEDTIRYKFSDKGIQEEIDSIDEMDELSPQEKWARKKEIYEDTQKNKYLNNFVVWLHNYTNLLAGKKDFSDRVWEENLGRGVYRLSKDMESRVAANMVAGNISSALTNVIPIAQMTAQVNEKYVLAAMSDTVKNMGKSNDGFAFQSDFLTNRLGSEKLVDDSLAKKLEKTPGLGQLLGIMETVDEFTSNVVVRGKYMQNINEGMSHEAAMKDADEFAAGLMADRSKGALPTIFETKNPVAKAMTMFQVEQNNQLQYLLKDLPRSLGDKEEIGKVLMMALFKYSLYSWIYNWMYEQIAGRKPAFSPIDLITDTGRRFYNVATGDMKVSQAVSDTVVSVAEELPFAAVPLGVLGLSDDAGRLPISGALPDLSNVLKLFDSEISAEKKKSILYKELSKPMYYLMFPVGGGQVKKTGEALYQMIANDGVSYYTNNNGSKNVQFVTDTSNPLKWAQSAVFGRWSTEEAREYVNNGFDYLSKSESRMYEYLKGLGIDSDKAYKQASKAKTEADSDGNGYLKTSEVVRYLDKTGMSKQDKANLFAILCPNVKNNPYKG